MEQPYSGRAIIEDDFSQMRITIPARKHWAIIIFIGAWMGGWAMGMNAVLHGIGSAPSGFGGLDLFMLFWSIGWTVGGVFALSILFWQLFGKEIITVESGRLTIEKKGALFVRPKTYDLSEVKNVRVQDTNQYADGFWGTRRRGYNAFMPDGIIKFDYGFKTVKFAGGIDEAEANYILERLRAKKLLVSN